MPIDESRNPTVPIPDEDDQTLKILDRETAEHGHRFVVQHDGLRSRKMPSLVVQKFSDLGYFTGYQTVKDLFDFGPETDRGQVIEDTFRNALAHKAVFIEVYQHQLLDHDASQLNDIGGHSLLFWNRYFHGLRRHPEYLQKAADPFPFVHGHTFKRKAAMLGDTVSMHYVISPHCSSNPRVGVINLLPD